MVLTTRHQYFVAVLSVAAACAAEWAWPSEFSRTQLLLGAIVISSGWGGFRPGLAAVVLASAVRHQWPGAHAGGLLQQAISAAEGVVMVIAIAALYQARVRAERLYAAATDETGTVRRHVTATQSLERQVQQAQKMEAIGRLASGIAHDFNNLLTGITGYAELIITNLPETNPMIQDAYEIRRAALSATRLTKQLLMFSRHQRSNPEVLDVNAVVARTAGVLKRTLGEDIEVTLALDPTIKAVKADASHIEQIVLNLAINARDAMPNGGHLTITTTMYERGAEGAPIAPPGEYVRLAIADTGCGISEEIQSKVFEPFFTTKGAAGTGLGLATVYGTVKQSGGHIQLDSTVGAGTTFTIDLPATPERPATCEAMSVPPRFIEGYATVLVVEDDQRVRELTELVLRRAGHDVVAAAGPREALAAMSAHAGVNLVLTDIVMPDMTGYELVDQLRRVVPGLRCLFMSGFPYDPVRAPIAAPFLAKPFTIESLTGAIQEAIAAG